MHMVARGSGIHMGALDPKEAPLNLSFSSVWMRENKFLSPMFTAQDSCVVDGVKVAILKIFQVNKCLLSHYLSPHEVTQWWVSLWPTCICSIMNVTHLVALATTVYISRKKKDHLSLKVSKLKPCDCHCNNRNNMSGIVCTSHYSSASCLLRALARDEAYFLLGVVVDRRGDGLQPIVSFRGGTT